MAAWIDNAKASPIRIGLRWQPRYLHEDRYSQCLKKRKCEHQT